MLADRYGTDASALSQSGEKSATKEAVDLNTSIS